MIPFAGSLATGGKLINKGVKAIDKADDIYDAVKGAGKAEIKSLPKIEGRGVSKGGRQPGNLKEQLAMEEAMTNPNNGKILKGKNTDPRWPADDGWVKKAQNVNGVEVHYQYNPKTGQIDDFKLK